METQQIIILIFGFLGTSTVASVVTVVATRRLTKNQSKKLEEEVHGLVLESNRKVIKNLTDQIEELVEVNEKLREDNKVLGRKLRSMKRELNELKKKLEEHEKEKDGTKTA